MNWPYAITLNRTALLHITAGLVTMIGAQGAVSRRTYLAILSVVRAAEAALRRLIAIAALDVTVAPRSMAAAPVKVIPGGYARQTLEIRPVRPQKKAATSCASSKQFYPAYQRAGRRGCGVCCAGQNAR